MPGNKNQKIRASIVPYLLPDEVLKNACTGFKYPNAFGILVVFIAINALNLFYFNRLQNYLFIKWIDISKVLLMAVVLNAVLILVVNLIKRNYLIGLTNKRLIILLISSKRNFRVKRKTEIPLSDLRNMVVNTSANALYTWFYLKDKTDTLKFTCKRNYVSSHQEDSLMISETLLKYKNNENAMHPMEYGNSVTDKGLLKKLWTLGEKVFTTIEIEDGTWIVLFNDGKDETDLIIQAIDLTNFSVFPVSGSEEVPIPNIPDFAKTRTQKIKIGLNIVPKSPGVVFPFITAPVIEEHLSHLAGQSDATISNHSLKYSQTYNYESQRPNPSFNKHLMAWGLIILLGLVFHIIYCVKMAETFRLIPRSWVELGQATAIILSPVAISILPLTISLIIFLVKRQFFFGAYYVGVILSILLFSLGLAGNLMKKNDEKIVFKPNVSDSIYDPISIGIQRIDLGQLTKVEFAVKIKASYPAYKDVSDEWLTQKAIEKHPGYAKYIREAGLTLRYQNKWISILYPESWELSEVKPADASELYNVRIIKPGSKPAINISVIANKNPDNRYSLKNSDQSTRSNIAMVLKNGNLQMKYSNSSDWIFHGFPAKRSQYTISDLKNYNVNGEIVVFLIDQQVVIVTVNGEKGNILNQEVKAILDSLRFLT